jgi:hypothetical protein
MDIREEAAYWAGLIDGEGSVLLTNRNNGANRYPAVTITNTDRRIIEWVSLRFGGAVVTRRGRKPGHSTAYDWKVSYDKAMKVLDVVVPYLVTYKKDRALLLLNEYKSVTVRNGKYTESQKKCRDDFEKRFASVVPYGR